MMSGPARIAPFIVLAELTPQIKVQNTNVNDPSDAYRLMTGAEEPPYSRKSRPRTQGAGQSEPFASFA
jgi:hypothetical protein